MALPAEAPPQATGAVAVPRVGQQGLLVGDWDIEARPAFKRASRVQPPSIFGVNPQAIQGPLYFSAVRSDDGESVCGDLN